jgi:hypothetical protein
MDMGRRGVKKRAFLSNMGKIHMISMAYFKPDANCNGTGPIS